MRILGEHIEPGDWTARVERRAELVREAPWSCMQLVVAYSEDDALVVVHQRAPGDVVRHVGTRTADDQVRWQVERGDGMDLCPVVTW